MTLIANHVRKHALAAMLGAALLLLGLQVLFAYLAELEDISPSYGYVDALKYILWQAPRYLYELLPMAALVGAVMGLGMLASQSELTVMRAAGISLYKIVYWAVQAALVLACTAWLLAQFVLPTANANAKHIKSPEATSRVGELSGYYSKTLHDDRTSTMHYIDTASKEGRIGGLKIWQMDADGRITQLVSARAGVYQPASDNWLMQQVTEVNLATFSDSINQPPKQTSKQVSGQPLTNPTPSPTVQATPTNPVDIAQHYSAAYKRMFAEKQLTLPIKPSLIYSMTRAAEDLSISELYAYTEQLKDTTGASEHRLLFWQKLLAPLAVVSLVLIACSFVFGSLRGQSMGLRLVVALLVGLAFNYLQKLLGYMSIAYDASPFLFVLLPILISAGFGMYLLQQKR